jgi:hypothetical protein
MSLLTDHVPVRTTTKQHVLRPVVEVIKKKRETVGWKCRDCGATWVELPPIAERLDGCA